MKKYNVGIIGYGWAASAHIPAINGTTQARVTAVCSSRPQNPRELSSKYGGDISVYSDVHAMLANPKIHVVSVCSFPYQHTEHVIAAAKAGRHIIVEKPLALSWKDCLAMEAAVKKGKVRTCVCFEGRYSSQIQTTRAIIESGLIGTIHYGEIDYYHGIGPWYGQFRWNVRKDAGGSSLLTAGCHALDALLSCMGGEVVEVSSFDTKSKSELFEPYEYTTTSVTILKFKNGSVGKCAASVDCLQPYYFHTHLVGSHGSLLDNKFHSTKLGGLNKHAWSTLSMKLLDSGDVSDHPYQTQFQSFFDALDTGKEMPLTSLADALKTQKVIFAADKSAETGKPVKL
ncbi:MAG: Gfo/Idh/MocA family oxidoreductase [Verrucomicrobia bacterium]|nr:Gfo/Idh/MocA family oxidoreductase [Verrucomicrobiota bacterium]